MKTFLYYNTKVIVFLSIVLMGIFLPQNKIISLPVPNLVEVREELKKYAKVKAIEEKQLACMAKNIYYEAGNETYEGKIAVARVVMNRVRHGFASNPCNVIYQKTSIEDKIICQFSWVCNTPAPIRYVSDRWEESLAIATEVMYNGLRLPSDAMAEALYFHNTSVRPRWGLEQVAKIGNHIFYSDDPAPRKKH